MSFGADHSLESSDVMSIKSDFKSRTEELKQSLTMWRTVLLPLNNLLEWQHRHAPFIIIGMITFVFIFIFQANPPVLTLLSCIVLIIILIDLLAPIGIRLVFKEENWTSTEDAEYTKVCEHIANLEEHIKFKCESALKMRKERPMMYLMVGSIFLAFIAFCGQRVNNLLFFYLITLIVCLTPGVRHRQLIPFIRQYITHFWNNKRKSQ